MNAPRRPEGALEHEVLEVLWHADRALTPAQVRAELVGELAYTTVMTVLGRLHDKGLLNRTPRGRAYEYDPAVTESELAARRMTEVLDSSHDHARALSGFVGTLSARDAALLRRALTERGRT